MNTIHQIYNLPDTVAVLSSYAHREDNAESAIDRYTSRKLADLAKAHPVLICAQKKTDIQTETTEDYGNNIAVARIWKKGDISSFIRLLLYLLSFNKVKTILVEFEFNVFGGTIMNIGLLIALFVLRLFGKRIVFELHQVITNVAELEKHLGIHNPLLEKVYTVGIMAYFRCIGLVSHEVIVLEEELKSRLSTLVANKKISTLPHHMNMSATLNKENAKKKLGIQKNEFVVLIFGYLNWYKGIDWMVEQAKQFKNTNIRLVVAGGPNPYHISKPYYKKYFIALQKAMKKNPNITYTGFVKEEDMQTVFSAADLMVLPYRVFMAASGPFSQALSYGVPVLLSEKLKLYTKSADFAEAMTQSNISHSLLYFSLKKGNMVQLIDKIKNDTALLKSLDTFVRKLAELRSESGLVAKFEELLFPQAKSEASPYISRESAQKIQYT